MIKSMITSFLILFAAGWLGMCKSLDMPENIPSHSEKIDSLWQAYDSTDQKSFPETADAQLAAIEEMSEKMNRSVDYIGAIFERHNLLMQRAENGQVDKRDVVDYVFDRSPLDDSISGYLLSYVRAYSLWTYYNQYQNIIEDRTSLAEDSNISDFETWTQPQFIDAIIDHATDALHLRLKDEPLSKWKRVVTQMGDSTALRFRPNLYALMTNAVMEILSSQEMHSIPLQEHPVLKDEMWWADREAFINHGFGYGDETMGKLVRIYRQALIELEDPGVLLDIDLSRYNFILAHSRQSDRGGKWKRRVQELLKHSTEEFSRARLATELAEYFLGLRDDTDSLGRSGYLRAKDLIEEENLIDREDIFGERAKRVMHEILAPHLSANVESVQLPDRAILVSAMYRNVEKLDYSIYEVSPTLLDKINRRNPDEFEKALARQEQIEKGSTRLPQNPNFGMKTAEFGMESLPGGLYILVLRAGEAVYWQELQVSDLAVIQLDDHLVVMDRTNGRGVPNAEIILEKVDWRSRNRDTIFIQSNDQGIASNPAGGSVKIVKVKKGKRLLFPSKNIHSSSSAPSRSDRMKVRIFSDRSIYRPGQNIRFKGILYQYIKPGSEKTISGQEIEVMLRDPNRETVKKYEVVSDAFGSITGDFRIPDAAMPGTYHLATSFGTKTIEVAEYRRPGFELNTSWPEGVKYIAGDTVSLNLTAKSYSGFPLSEAGVRIFVYREYSSLWRYGIWPPRKSQSALTYEAEKSLDREGRIQIDFPTSEVEEGVAAKYRIRCEVTDAGGETHSIEREVLLSSSPYLLKASLPDRIVEEQLPESPLRLRNAMNAPVTAEVRWELNKIETPGKKYVDRYWTSPDTILIQREAFETNWPHLRYACHKEVEAVGVEVASGTLEIRGEAAIPEAIFSERKEGRYILKVRDESGRQLAREVFDYYEASSEIAIYEPELFWRNAPEEVDPGKSLSLKSVRPFTEGASMVAWKRANASLEVESGSDIELRLPAEDYRSIQAVVFSVIHNRVFSSAANIKVKRPHKKIEIEPVALNRETQPGQDEIYTFRINHPEPLQLMAGMYDESLDAIQPHSWSRLGLARERARIQWQALDFRSLSLRSIRFFDQPRSYYVNAMRWPQFNLHSYPRVRGLSETMAMDNAKMRSVSAADEEIASPRTAEPPPASELQEVSETSEEASIRENLKETVFFMPEIEKRSDGLYEISFSMTDALTRWKLMLFGHDKKLGSGVFTTSVVSSQLLSIRPYFPRVLRSGDTIELAARVESNVELESAYTHIQIKHVISGEDLTEQLISSSEEQEISVRAGQQKRVSWQLIVPKAEDIPALKITTHIRSDKGVDAESHILPVLSNRIAVTEALPLELNELSSDFWDVSEKAFELNLKQEQRPLKYKLDVNLQPVWLAVQSLPYLSKPKYPSATALINVLFANSLAIEVAESIPNLQNQIQALEAGGQGGSSLSRNQEWKNTTLDQSPWMQVAQNESQRTQNIAKLLDKNRQQFERQRILREISDMQNADGGFPWMPGGRSSPYISQYLAKEFLRMKSLDLVADKEAEIDYLLEPLLAFCYRHFDKHLIPKLRDSSSFYFENELVYMYYLGVEASASGQLKAWKEWDKVKPLLEKVLKEKIGELSFGQQALVGLAWHRENKSGELERLLRSLSERARKSDHQGWSWGIGSSYSFYHSALESQALIIELAEKAGETKNMSRQAKKYLLKEKQVNHWENSKTTAAVIHALLLQGGDGWRNPKTVKWSATGEQNDPDLKIGDTFISWEKSLSSDEDFTAPVQSLSIENPNPFPIWGGLYLQYSSPIGLIESSSEGPLSVRTQYFLQKQGEQGPELTPIDDNTRLEQGEILVARLQVQVDRDMDFVHIEQFRAANLEPITQKSGYEVNGNFVFYRSVKDEGTHFFVEVLPKGTHVFEFKERVAHQGVCTGGFTRIESYYAPEFKSHSSGEKIITYDR
jgi:hypothetical protein